LEFVLRRGPGRRKRLPYLCDGRRGAGTEALCELTGRLRASVRELREVEDGYVLRLDGSAFPLADAAAWIGFERQCCPFLTFQLTVSGSGSEWGLTLSGPPGAKAVLAAEFAKK
jgi:hypothetical protein